MSGVKSGDFENDRKGRKEGKERRKVSEGWRCSTRSEPVAEILMCVSARVCVCPIEPHVYKSESQAVCVLQGRCFLQCNLSLWWNV